MIILTGLIYPLILTGIAKLTMPHQANGSLITSKGKIVGSSLIAQKFESDSYFWPRPSAVDFNTLASGGSNLGPTSFVLQETVKLRRDKLLKANGSNAIDSVPSDLLFASGSGLDPHISLRSAYFQIDRIAGSRKFDEHDKKSLSDLIGSMAIYPYGFLGPVIVNVLELNLALDGLRVKP